jgi:SPP1 gp7 family putative phage head morphogenesis protein
MIPEEQKVAIREQIRSARRKAAAKVAGVPSSLPLEAQYYRDLSRIVGEVDRLIEKAVFPLLKRNEAIYKKAPELAVVDADPVLIKGVNPPPIPSLRSKEARDLSDQIREQIDKIKESLGAPLENYALKIATDTAIKGGKANRAAFVADIKKAIGVDLKKVLTEGGIEGAIRDSVRTNVALIKTIPEQYFEQIQGMILQGIDEGKDFFSIKLDLLQVNEKNMKRARVIARDQVSKMNSAVNRLRQEAIGITHYIWRTVGDESVRSEHKALNGRKFAWSEIPPGGYRPGEAIQCRCIAEPVLAGFYKEAKASG